jgi:hypothetical protein
MEDRKLNVLGWSFFIVLCLTPITWQVKLLVLITVLIFAEINNQNRTQRERTNWMLLLLFNLEEDENKRIESIDKSKEEVKSNLQFKEIEEQLMGESGASRTLFLGSFGFILLSGFIFYLTTNFEDFLKFLELVLK